MGNESDVLTRIYELKDDLIQIIQFAIDIAKREKKFGRTSKYNMTVDIKDNLHEPLKTLAEESGIQYCRSNLSQYFVIDNKKVKIKFHNSLCKSKREIIEQAETPQLKIPFKGLVNPPTLEESEWEIGIETSAERTALKILRIVDFPNKNSETIFNHKFNVIQFPKSSNNENEKNTNEMEIKNKIRTKEKYKSTKEKEDKNESKIENDI